MNVQLNKPNKISRRQQLVLEMSEAIICVPVPDTVRLTRSKLETIINGTFAPKKRHLMMQYSSESKLMPRKLF